MLVPIISRPTTAAEMEEIAEKTAIELPIFRILGEEPLPGEWDRHMNRNHRAVSNLLRRVYHKSFAYPDRIKSKNGNLLSPSIRFAFTS